MKILFVYPNVVESPKDISQGLASLSAVLKKAGHKTALLDSTFGLANKEIIAKVKTFQPDLVAVTAASNDILNAVKITRLIREHTAAPTICGGFHPTVAPEDAIKYGCFDMICIGEGEYALLELAESLEKGEINTNIKNIWFKKPGGIIRNEPRPLIQNLDKLPFPDRELFDYQKYIRWNQNKATFITTRGCPFRCSYCINHALQKLYSGKGKYLRFRSVGNVIEEIKAVKQKYKFDSIEFYDDTFTLDKKCVMKFCKKYVEEIGLPFEINARVNAVDKEIFLALKSAGCTRVSIGIESGNEHIMNDVLRRDTTINKIKETFSWAKEAGLQTYAFNMIGLPFETKEEIEDTIVLNRDVCPDYIGISIFNAYPGTELYDVCKKNGWLASETAAESYFKSSNIRHPNFTEKELNKIRNIFGFKVYFRKKPIKATLDLLDKNLSGISQYSLIRALKKQIWNRLRS